jgi:hypothetical protein
MEAEYMTASDAANDTVWLREFVIELGVCPSAQDPVNIYCDNTGAIANAKEPRFHSTAKYILRRCHAIRGFVKDGDIKICKVHTDLNVADPLTKQLPLAKDDQHRMSIGVRTVPGLN